MEKMTISSPQSQNISDDFFTFTSFSSLGLLRRGFLRDMLVLWLGSWPQQEAQMKRVDGIWYVKIGSIWHNTHSRSPCLAFLFARNFQVKLNMMKARSRAIGGAK